jgi:hypothetical protein
MWKRPRSNGKKKTKDNDDKLRRRAKERLWSEAILELQPLAIGSVAMVASSYCNQGMYMRNVRCVSVSLSGSFGHTHWILTYMYVSSLHSSHSCPSPHGKID